MNRNMVLAEWNRARQSLRAAETLTRDGCYADAVSRSYYAILHAAKAALHVQDIAAESHPAVRRMFGLHLVKTGEIEPEWSACLVESLDDRLAADYDVEIN
ncbi:MAG: HEPN domain-containing protein, partial [Candidatus Binatia bacterium]